MVGWNKKIPADWFLLGRPRSDELSCSRQQSRPLARLDRLIELFFPSATVGTSAKLSLISILGSDMSAEIRRELARKDTVKAGTGWLLRCCSSRAGMTLRRELEARARMLLESEGEKKKRKKKLPLYCAATTVWHQWKLSWELRSLSLQLLVPPLQVAWSAGQSEPYLIRPS